MLFSSVGQNKRGRTNVADLLLIQMAIYGENSYLGHIFQDVD